MKKEEAIQWFEGKRSMCNIILQDPIETRQVRICQADAAQVQVAYWTLRAYKEGLIE